MKESEQYKSNNVKRYYRNKKQSCFHSPARITVWRQDYSTTSVTVEVVVTPSNVNVVVQ